MNDVSRMKPNEMLPKTKIAILFLALLTLSVSCKEEKTVLFGEFKNSTIGEFPLYKILPDDVVFWDTIQAIEGKFIYQLNEKDIGIYLIAYNEDNLYSFIAQKGDRLIFSGNADSLKQTFNVKGNQESELLLQTRQKLDQFYDKTEQLSKMFINSRYTNQHEAVIHHVDSIYQTEFDAHKKYLTQFIRQNKGKLATLLAFYQKIGRVQFFCEENDSELLKEIYEELTKTHPQSIYVTSVSEKF